MAVFSSSSRPLLQVLPPGSPSAMLTDAQFCELIADLAPADDDVFWQAHEAQEGTGQGKQLHQTMADERTTPAGASAQADAAGSKAEAPAVAQVHEAKQMPVGQAVHGGTGLHPGKLEGLQGVTSASESQDESPAAPAGDTLQTESALQPLAADSAVEYPERAEMSLLTHQHSGRGGHAVAAGTAEAWSWAPTDVASESAQHASRPAPRRLRLHIRRAAPAPAAALRTDCRARVASKQLQAPPDRAAFASRPTSAAQQEAAPASAALPPETSASPDKAGKPAEPAPQRAVRLRVKRNLAHQLVAEGSHPAAQQAAQAAAEATVAVPYALRRGLLLGATPYALHQQAHSEDTSATISAAEPEPAACDGRDEATSVAARRLTSSPVQQTTAPSPCAEPAGACGMRSLKLQPAHSSEPLQSTPPHSADACPTAGGQGAGDAGVAAAAEAERVSEPEVLNPLKRSRPTSNTAAAVATRARADPAAKPEENLDDIAAKAPLHRACQPQPQTQPPPQQRHRPRQPARSGEVYVSGGRLWGLHPPRSACAALDRPEHPARAQDHSYEAGSNWDPLPHRRCADSACMPAAHEASCQNTHAPRAPHMRANQHVQPQQLHAHSRPHLQSVQCQPQPLPAPLQAAVLVLQPDGSYAPAAAGPTNLVAGAVPSK
jgi:hypothetical protein